MANKCILRTENICPNLIKCFSSSVSVSVARCGCKMAFGNSVFYKSTYNFLLVKFRYFIYFLNSFSVFLIAFSDAFKILLSISKKGSPIHSPPFNIFKSYSRIKIFIFTVFPHKVYTAGNAAAKVFYRFTRKSLSAEFFIGLYPG